MYDFKGERGGHELVKAICLSPTLSPFDSPFFFSVATQTKNTRHTHHAEATFGRFPVVLVCYYG